MPDSNSFERYPRRSPEIVSKCMFGMSFLLLYAAGPMRGSPCMGAVKEQERTKENFRRIVEEFSIASNLTWTGCIKWFRIASAGLMPTAPLSIEAT